MLNLDRAELILSRLPIRDRYSRRLVPFRLKWAQRQILAAARRQQAKGRPVRIIILKARRIGGSAFTDGFSVLHAMESETALGLIVAHQFKSSAGLFEVPLTMLDRALPGKFPLSKACGITHTKHVITIPHKGGSEATISLATAGAVSGAGGRGLSFTFLHLSEAAYFPGVQPFTSLLPTVPYDPSTWIVIESTANGRVGPGAAFYDYWQKACEGRNDYEPVFAPWHKDPSYIRPADGGQPPYDEYEQWLIDEFQCTPEQIAWWRATLETECKGTLQIMQQEYPASAEEAFVATGDPTFESAERSYVRDMICEPEAVGDVKCEPGGVPYFEKNGTGDWCIWKMPVAGHKYFVGADAARGLQLEEGDIEPVAEGDFAAASIVDANTNEIVARYAKRDNPEVLAHKLYGIARFYNRAMVAIEITGNLGLWAQKVLRDPPYSYSNLYRWRGSRDDRVGSQNRIDKRNVIGWETTQRSRDYALDAFRAAIRQGFIRVYDRILLQQMENAQRKEGFRWEVIRGHDDILMSAIVAWVSREQWGPPVMGANMTAGGSAPPDPEGTPQPRIGQQWKDGPPVIDGVSLSLARHYHQMQATIKESKKANPLQGV